MPAPSSAPPPAGSGRRVAVLGGGITGLTAAWHLRRSGADAVVFEAAERPGGVVVSRPFEGWLHEGGPNTLLEGSPEVTELIDAAGLGSRRLEAAPSARRRYVVRGGRLLAVPASPGAFLRSPLLSWKAKLGLLAEPFRPRRREPGEESVAGFVRRRLGAEILDYAVDPFVAGVYAGDPDELSLSQAFPRLAELEREHGSLLRGAIRARRPKGGGRARMVSFPEGLSELPRALARELGDDLRLGCRVTAISREKGGWAVEFENGARDRRELFSAVVSALPAGALVGLPLRGVPAAAGLGALAGIVHPAVVSVFCGYRREEVAHPLDGFGLLVPRVEGRRILGTLFSSTLFPGRAPPGHVALTTFVGGLRNPQLALLDEEALREVVSAELSDLLGAKGEPAAFAVRRWPKAIPQYNLGYQRFRDACAAVEAAAPGFFIGGNCRDGISLSDCIRSGRRLARAAAGLSRAP